jgi:precorrin-6B methylase 1
MTKFKISFHCGQVSSFVVEEHESKSEALIKYNDLIATSKQAQNLLAIADVLINPKHITFVVVEELIEKTEEPAAGATIEV